MSDQPTLVRFTCKGRTIAVNPARVNYVEESKENRNYTYVRFCGEGDCAYVYIEAPVEEVITKLTASTESPDELRRAATDKQP
jgi:hypothetical protein